MLSRRSLLVNLGASVGTLGSVRAHAAAVLTEDGFYKEPWFLESLLELAEDLEETARTQKRLAIMWELRGCPFCRQTHLINFAKPEIEAYIKERFNILQLNIIGLREVTDFDGEKLSEKGLAIKYGVRVTPTIQFFPEGLAGLAAKWPEGREITRVEGYQQPNQFVATFRFIAERAYERGTLADYLKNHS